MLRVTHNNGTWKIFDTVSFRDVATFRLEKDALEALAKMVQNRKAKRIQNP